MKSARKSEPRRIVRRRVAPLSLSARVERLEKQMLFKQPTVIAPEGVRFINLGANGAAHGFKASEHVAVLQPASGLIWTAAPLSDGKELTHAEAAQAAKDLDLLGHKDWRLPTIQELLSIIDYDRYDPAVDPSHFKGPYSWTWSSTLAKAPAGYAWSVGLCGGHSGRLHRDVRLRVRAVRAGQQLGLLE